MIPENTKEKSKIDFNEDRFSFLDCNSEDDMLKKKSNESKDLSKEVSKDAIKELSTFSAPNLIASKVLDWSKIKCKNILL